MVINTQPNPPQPLLSRKLSNVHYSQVNCLQEHKGRLKQVIAGYSKAAILLWEYCQNLTIKHLNGLSTSLSGNATKSSRVSWRVLVWKGHKRGSEQWRGEEETAIEQEQLTAHAQWVCLKIIINNFDCILRKGCRNNFLLKQQKLLKWQLVIKTTIMWTWCFNISGCYFEVIFYSVAIMFICYQGNGNICQWILLQT